jgi:hypothetical protein
LGGTQGRSGLLFSGGKDLKPLLLHKASSPVPQIYATFVTSHNGGKFNPFLESAQRDLKLRDERASRVRMVEVPVKSRCLTWDEPVNKRVRFDGGPDRPTFTSVRTNLTFCRIG